MPAKIQNTVLIALLKNASDFHILEKQGWYRIPIKTAPTNIKKGTAKTIAFYIPKKTTKLLPKIEYYAEIASVTKVKRKDLFPNEDPPLKSPETPYYKIQIKELNKLERPIINLCPRRILFIPTTKLKFQIVINQEFPDFNLLFNASPLEDKLYKNLIKHNIRTHREYYHETTKGNFKLDFALRCKNAIIDIECDGSTYHDKKESVHYDKKRNNALTAEGWQVLRYTTTQINEEMDSVIAQVKETAEKYGGYEKYNDHGQYQYKPKIAPGEQGRLFD